jgi:hypothetical protein
VRQSAWLQSLSMIVASSGGLASFGDGLLIIGDLLRQGVLLLLLRARGQFAIEIAGQDIVAASVGRKRLSPRTRCQVLADGIRSRRSGCRRCAAPPPRSSVPCACVRSDNCCSRAVASSSLASRRDESPMASAHCSSTRPVACRWPRRRHRHASSRRPRCPVRSSSVVAAVSCSACRLAMPRARARVSESRSVGAGAGSFIRP